MTTGERKREFQIALIPGDGIGPEVVEATIPILEKVVRKVGHSITWREFPWGCDYFLATGRMMPEDGLERLRPLDAILLGAIGSPGVPDYISVGGLILPIRRGFDQYVNLRPMRTLPGVESPLVRRTGSDLDLICVRENSEGEYVGKGGRHEIGSAEEWAEQTAVFTRRGIARIVRFAFELASRRPRRLLASATKSNALQYSMVLWDEVVEEVASRYPHVEWRPYHVDALAARMVSHPDTLDLIVASNLFGDILTDLGAALTGSLGLAPGANLNPDGQYPSMFEPIHGSAPDIAGTGTANPIGTLWAGALMLDHLGLREAHDQLLGAIGRVLAAGTIRTPDLGGSARTSELATAITAEL